MSAALQSLGALCGRALLSVIFLMSGYSKIMDWSGTADFMAAHGLTNVEVLLPLAIVAEIGGGVALLLGFQTRLAALGLFVFLIPTTLTFHNFWTLEDPERQQQMIHFLKNTAILGGLLECCALGGGALSIDAAFLRRRV